MTRGKSIEEPPQVQLVRPSGQIIALGTFLRARQIAAQFQEKVDEAFTWAQEVLVEAKRTFENGDLVLLPKTPSAKRARKQLRKSNKIKKNENSDESHTKGAKRRSSQQNSEVPEESGQSQSSRTLRASKRDVPSSRATRNTRARKESDNEAEPTKCLFKDNDCSSVPDAKEEEGVFISSQEQDNQNLRLDANPHEKIPHNMSTEKSSPFVKSPRAIPGFSSLSVKHKAEAFDSFARQSHSACETPPNKNKSRTETPVFPSTPNSEKIAVAAVSSLHSPMEVDCVADTPEDTDKSSGKHRSSRKLSLRRSIAEKQLQRLSNKYKGSKKRSSTYRRLRQSLEKTLASCDKQEIQNNKLESDDDTEDMASAEDASASSESETPAPQKPPRSKVRTHKAPLKQGSSQSDNDTPVEQQQPKRTRSKMRVVKEPPKLGAPEDEIDGSYDPKSAPSADDEATPDVPGQPIRSTRSKMRVNKPVVPTLAPASSDDEEELEDEQPGPLRSTRSKMRNWKDKANENMLDVAKDSPRGPVKRGKLPSSGSGSDTATPAKRQCAEMSTDSSYHTGNESICNASRYTPGGVRIAVPVHPRSFVSSVKRLNRNPNTSISVVTSFIDRNTPKKVSIKDKESQKRKEIEQKQRDAEDRVRRKQEEMQRKADEMKKKHLDRQKQVAARREENQRIEEQSRRNQQRKALDSKALTSRMMDEKLKEERERQKQRERKAQEVESKRKQEEEMRLLKQQEKERLQREHEDMIQRQREQEEAERQRRLIEQRRNEEERRIEAERKLAEEKERVRREEETRLRQVAEERRGREEREKQEREIRLKMEREREAEREKQRQEELRRLREAELTRIREEAAREKLKAEEERRLKAAINKHNTSLQQANASMSASSTSHTSSKNLNTTMTLETHDENKPETNQNSYPITPQKKPVKKKGSNNYNIDELNSEDSTDDEDAPRKKIPNWASGSSLKVQIVYQNYHPPDLDEVFRDCFQSLDLNIMFNKSRPRFNKRTSSACWNSPMMKPSGKPQDQSFS